jgi:hypothetical protein
MSRDVEGCRGTHTNGTKLTGLAGHPGLRAGIQRVLDVEGDVEGHTLYHFIDEISFTLLSDKRMNQMNMCQFCAPVTVINCHLLAQMELGST